MPTFDVRPSDTPRVWMPSSGDDATLLCELYVSADVETIRHARGFARQVLDTRAGAVPVVDDAVLIVSELLTNAALHGSDGIDSEVMVKLTAIGGRLRVEVHDESPLIPSWRTTSNDAEDGRGLMVVDALADRWGSELTAGGKFVWCELSAWPEQTTAQHA